MFGDKNSTMKIILYLNAHKWLKSKYLYNNHPLFIFYLYSTYPLPILYKYSTFSLLIWLDKSICLV